MNVKTTKDISITDLMKEAHAAELEAVENYLANSVWLDGLGAREVAESLAEDVTEELGHATKLAHRLKQLGVCPPGSLALPRNQKALQPPKYPTDVRSVVEGVLAAEKDAIAHHQRLRRKGPRHARLGNWHPGKRGGASNLV